MSQLTGNEKQPVILRQDTRWTSASGTTYVVLLSSPFTQGLIDPTTTEVIISTPSSRPQNGPSISIDRMAITASLSSKPFLPSLARSTATRSTRQQRAMLNFSADGFLSASCGVDPARERREARREAVRFGEGMDELEEEDEDEDEGFWDDELDDDASEEEDDPRRCTGSVDSEGSITPRPGSYIDVPDLQHDESDSHSAVANGVTHTDVAKHTAGAVEDGGEDTFRGFAFTPFALRRRPISASTRAVSSKGKAREELDAEKGSAGWPDDEAVAWLSLKGLARAGVFVGDWVSSCSFRVDDRVADPFGRCC